MCCAGGLWSVAEAFSARLWHVLSQIDLELIKFLDSYDMLKPAEVDDMGMTAAECAAEAGNLPILQWLFARDPSLFNDKLALYTAEHMYAHLHVLQWLHTRGLFDAKKSKNGRFERIAQWTFEYSAMATRSGIIGREREEQTRLERGAFRREKCAFAHPAMASRTGIVENAGKDERWRGRGIDGKVRARRRRDQVAQKRRPHSVAS